MKKLKILSIIFASIILLSGSLSIKATDLKDPNCTPALPAGSYQQSCDTCCFDGFTVLRCHCPRLNGSLNEQAKVIMNDPMKPQQNADIGNFNGALRWNYKIPDGSYQNSCDTCTLTTSDILSCHCPRSHGGWNDGTNNTPLPTLDMNKCFSGSVSNNNGNLVCDLPEGEYQNSCRDCSINSSDGSLQCMCDFQKYTYDPINQTWGFVPTPIKTSLPLNDCRGKKVKNMDGKLYCE